MQQKLPTGGTTVPNPKPSGSLAYKCPTCGADVGQQCRRSPRGLSYTVTTPTPCKARSNLYWGRLGRENVAGKTAKR